MIDELLPLLYGYKFKNVVFSKSLHELVEPSKYEMCIYFSEDPRSMLYIATGIAAETQLPVVVICKGDNESRSSYSGLTEAFYRKLPILFITIGGHLDYTKELNDCCVESFSGLRKLDNAIIKMNQSSLPVHLSINNTEINDLYKHQIVIDNQTTLTLEKTLSSDCYLFIGQLIKNDFFNFACKVVENKACIGLEGCLANVLGASLAKKRRRYIGLVTDTEFLHDINTLGNINCNDRLLFIVICNNDASFIEKYAVALDYHVETLDKLDTSSLENILNNKKKTILILRR